MLNSAWLCTPARPRMAKLDWGWMRYPGDLMKKMDPDWKHSPRQGQQSVRRGVTATDNVTITALET